MPCQLPSASATASATRRVEVVGGLVEQQDVVPAADELGEGELGLLAARQRGGVLEDLVAAQAEHAEEAAELALGQARRLLPHVLDQRPPGRMPSCSWA